MALRVRVCRVDDVPRGARRGFLVAGVDQPVMVTNLDGELIASASMCPHEDVSLLDGSQDGAVITCPGHAYQFDLHTGRCSHDPHLVLTRYRVTVVGGDLWVDLV